ncbi:MAG: tyrosine-type recombinase/integrase [Bacteroidales bacterium]
MKIAMNFYLKDSQGWNPQKWKKTQIRKTDLPTPIILYVHYKASRFKIPIEQTARPSEWDFERQRYRTARNVTNAIEKNTRLAALKVKAEKALLDYLNDNDQVFPTAAELRERIKIAFNLKEQTRKDLFTFFQQIIDQKIYDAGDTPHRNTDIPSYQYTLEALQKYAAKKRTRVDFDTIDLDFYHSWKKFLAEDLGLKTNTIGVRIRRLKSVMIRATAIGLNKNLIYQDPAFKTISEESKSIYLSEAELDKLNELELTPDLDIIRDLFLVLCWTGLRESDLNQVKRSNITNDTLHIKQQKTGGRISIPLHPVVMEILKKYDNELPTRTQQYMNRKLKLISVKLAEKLPLAEKDYSLIKTHTGRRTFASNMILRGIPARDVMAVTGHRTERDFYRYLKMAQTELNQNIRLSFANDVKLKKAN